MSKEQTLMKFLKSKIKTEYDTCSITPWYKGYWYYNPSKDKSVVVIIPLNIPLIILRNLYLFFKYPTIILSHDFHRFYDSQINSRKEGAKQEHFEKLQMRYYNEK